MLTSNRLLLATYRVFALLALLSPCAVLAFQPVDKPEESPGKVGSVAPGPGKAATGAEALLADGEKALQEGDYKKARESFARAASLNPQDPRSRLSLAFSEFALGDFEHAATSAREVMKMAPDLAATPMDLRGLFGETETLEKQYDNLEGITQLHAKSSRMHLLLGFVQYFAGSRHSGARTLVDHIAANPDDLVIRPFVEIAGRVNDPGPPPDERAMAQPAEREPIARRVEQEPIAEPFELMGPPWDGATVATDESPQTTDEPPRKVPAYGQRHPRHVGPPLSNPPNSPVPATVVEPHRVNPEVGYPPARESDNLEATAISVFCREEGLDPHDNQVVARVTEETVDEDTGEVEAEVEMHWVEWKSKNGGRKAKPKSETIELRFDDRGRLIDYND